MYVIKQQREATSRTLQKQEGEGGQQLKIRDNRPGTMILKSRNCDVHTPCHKNLNRRDMGLLQRVIIYKGVNNTDGQEIYKALKKPLRENLESQLVKIKEILYSILLNKFGPNLEKKIAAEKILSRETTEEIGSMGWALILADKGNLLSAFINKLISNTSTIILTDEDDASRKIEKHVILYQLHAQSMSYNSIVECTQEIQSLGIKNSIFSTSNPSGFALGETVKESTFPNNVAGSHFVLPPQNTDGAHAEIILLAQLINLVFKSGSFPKSTIYLGGQKPPCEKCQQIINLFVTQNNNISSPAAVVAPAPAPAPAPATGPVTLEYITVKTANMFGMSTARQASNVAGYVNAMQVLCSEITEDSINTQYPHIEGNSGRAVLRTWLTNMLNVIRLTPTD